MKITGKWQEASGQENGRATARVVSCILFLLPAFITGCGSILPRQDTPVAIWKPEKPAAATTKKGGGYYLNDGPGDNPPANLDAIPDAVPKAEPLHKAASRPYTVLGQTYTPDTSLKPYKETGVASWYGRRYHGQKTSTGEIYDMYAMTAAHTTLPLPSYVRVTNLKNNKSVVVRVNDRGPFHSDRLIDLSYTAAYKLGVLAGGSTPVLVESIDPANYSAAPVYASAPKQPEPLPAATPLAEKAQPLAAPAEVVASSGHFVQLGAFGMQENAEHFRDRLKLELAQLSDKLQIYAADGLFRVRAGPYQSSTEAGQIASEIKNALNIKAVLTTR
ncbi:MAG: septal ring lytic transglycosylase RlpA family protein [Sulfuricella sp.]|nr:septal ring lytic transglycosylase RlpA family protein [Sulfuricella sp.]